VPRSAFLRNYFRLASSEPAAPAPGEASPFRTSDKWCAPTASRTDYIGWAGDFSMISVQAACAVRFPTRRLLQASVGRSGCQLSTALNSSSPTQLRFYRSIEFYRRKSYLWCQQNMRNLFLRIAEGNTAQAWQDAASRRQPRYTSPIVSVMFS
jgi:hypothetical protein